jgi:hypothetical protein
MLKAIANFTKYFALIICFLVANAAASMALSSAVFPVFSIATDIADILIVFFEVYNAY